MKFRPIIRGIISYIPIINLALSKIGTGGSSSSKYCYSVWMRHLKYLELAGMSTMPEVVAEIGPGDSLGLGFSALLSGSKKYFALDIVKHANNEKNLKILDEISDYFTRNLEIPNDDEFLMVNPVVSNLELPNLIIKKSKKDIKNLIADIKNSLLSSSKSGIEVSYIVPWNLKNILPVHSCDLIISQAVMEHIPDIDTAYKTMHNLLKNEGYISHQIDFKSHETADCWYGHFTYSKFLWRIIMHGRKYLINREPFSRHILAIESAGFKIITVIPVYSKRIPVSSISPCLRRSFRSADFVTSSALIIAKKSEKQ